MISLTHSIRLLPLCAVLLATLPACPEVEPSDPPDAAVSGCTSAAECAPGRCESATCEQGECVYWSADDYSACTVDAASGFCRGGTCRTEFRVTHAICLIADFSDNVLENYSGAGFASEQDIRASLDDMERHWWWMSQGAHRFAWTIQRITLDQTLSATAFADWVAFRDEAVRQAAAIIDFDQYDADHDGLLDAMYIIVADNGLQADYMMGGMSRHQGANVFVDPQSGESVSQRAYGNFNHEVGHCLGLPDLYGPYGTINYLSLMHDSWPQPANGFCIYDKQRLGWFAPQRMTTSTTGVELLRAEENFSGIRIDAPQPGEYFLVEYRRRPETGYGSTEVPYDGLAIYHAFEPATQSMDPPLLKLMAADGAINADTAPRLTDFWSPENGSGSFVAKSYLGGGDLFRIEHIQRSERGLTLDVVMLGGAITPGPDLLANGSFESGSGLLPDGWATESAEQHDERFDWVSDVKHDGSKAVRLSMAQPNDTRFIQTVDGLVVGTGYLLCGWLRGQDVVGDANQSIGANVSRIGTWDHSAGLWGSFDWTQQCAAFKADATSATVGCRLGFYYSVVTGTSWCDGLSLVALESAF